MRLFETAEAAKKIKGGLDTRSLRAKSPHPIRHGMLRAEDYYGCARKGEAWIFAGSYGNLIPTPPFEVAPDTPSVLTHAFRSFMPCCANAYC